MISTQPLISVAIPCYNSTDTLPLALASLISQTYINWECIIVDDGSTDNPKAIVDTINDDRIRFMRLESNKGRAVARQKALDLAQGEYLCMIDADDWIYPSKLEQQVAIMEAHPDLAVLSAGMAITNAAQEIVGVRLAGAGTQNLTVFPPLSTLAHPPIAFAPSILRMTIARKYRFDSAFEIAEDKDYLLQILLNHASAVMRDVLYVYSEIDSITLNKITRSYRNNRKMFLKYRKSAGFSVYHQVIISLFKESIYRVLFGMGYGERLIRGRSSLPSQEQCEDYHQACALVREQMR